MRGAAADPSRLAGVSLRIYDTATREVRDFVPLVEGKVGLYVCGLTVQSEPHVFQMPAASDMRFHWVHADLAALDPTEARELVVDALFGKRLVH